MPSRVLVHLPEPEPPQLVDPPPRRPARGEEFPRGWTVADYQLEHGNWEGEDYAYVIWVVPLIADAESHEQEVRDTILHILEEPPRGSTTEPSDGTEGDLR